MILPNQNGSEKSIKGLNILASSVSVFAFAFLGVSLKTIDQYSLKVELVLKVE